MFVRLLIVVLVGKQEEEDDKTIDLFNGCLTTLIIISHKFFVSYKSHQTIRRVSTSSSSSAPTPKAITTTTLTTPPLIRTRTIDTNSAKQKTSKSSLPKQV